jgi:hypothetical protein
MEEVLRTRREVTETTEQDEIKVEEEKENGSGSSVGSGDSGACGEERGRKMSKKTVTTTVRVPYA